MRVLADYDYNYYDVERTFVDAMYQCGMAPADNGVPIRLDGAKHRFKVVGDKGNEKSGEYCVYMDEAPAGWFKCWKASVGTPYTTWCYKSETFSSMTEEERISYLEKRKAKKLAQDKVDAANKAEAVRKCRLEWGLGTPASPAFGYCMKKKLQSVHGARILIKPSETLLIPYVNVYGELMCVQSIGSDGVKLFPANGSKHGNFSVLTGGGGASLGGERLSAQESGSSTGLMLTGRVWVCEGWATAASVQEATGDIAIAAADAGNLLPVCKNLREAFPAAEFVVGADNDRYKNKGNPGGGAAFRVFEELGLPFVEPDFAPGEKLSDWNDYACKHGLKKTRAALLSKLEKFKSGTDYVVRHSVPQWLDVVEASGKPMGTIGNLEALLAFLRIKVGYDEVKKEEILEVPGGAVFCGDNAVNAAIAEVYSASVKWGYPQKNLDLFMTNIASRNVINPVKDWILSERWDGSNRLGTLYESLVLRDGYPVWLRNALVRKWLLSGVAAVMCDSAREPFSADGALVLQGNQGIGKTTWFRSLAGRDEWFGNGLSIDPRNKDSIIPATKCFVVEMGEIDSTFRKADISVLKAFITNSTDVIREPYGKRACNYQRRTIFCGTVNQASFLMDKTGNRRYWTIPIRALRRIDPANVQQIWAQVYEELWLLHEADPRNDDLGWWLSKEEKSELDAQNWEFEVPDPVEDMIYTRLDWDSDRKNWQYMTCVQILSDLGVANAASQTGLCMKAAEAIRKKTGQSAERRHGGRVYLVPRKLPDSYRYNNLYL